MSLPTHTAAWTLNSQDGPSSLTFTGELPIPKLGANDVLVKLHAASLNARDLMGGSPAMALRKPNLIPGSDGAGTILALGSFVTKFQINDKVVTHLPLRTSPEDDDDNDTEPPTFDHICAGLGHGLDGTLTAYGIFDQRSLVHMPSNLEFLEAATLTCSGLTAWNALFGLRASGREPEPGKTVLVLGSSGVSVAALQFAIAAGATVIATTSSEAKTEKLKALGAQQVINHRENSNWGEAAKKLTPSGKGVDTVVDVGGASTLQQSLAAVRVDGLIAATGVLGDGPPDGKVPTILDCLFASCVARGIFAGSKAQFQEMNRFIEANDIRPVLDERVFDMSSIREAYELLMEGKHFSKTGIRLA